MGFKKGHKLSGSREGSQNKTTVAIKMAFQNLVESNIDNITRWMKDVAAENPKEALEFMLKFSEYIIPKLNRTDIDIKSDGKELRSWTVKTE